MNTQSLGRRFGHGTLACLRAPFAPAAVAIVLSVLFHQSVRADDSQVVRDFLDNVSQQAADAEKASQSALAGTGGWLFFVPELRALSAGRFWGEAALRVSRSSNPDYADPLPAIVDFHNQLRDAGIELLVMPTPGKAAVYPEAISRMTKPFGGEVPPRLDEADREFYDLLTQQGVNVIDLLPTFLEHRNDPAGSLYCKTDSHWSGRGVALAAQAVADEVDKRGWLRDVQKVELKSETRDVALSGDLALMLNEKNPEKETIPLTFVGTGDELTPVSPDRQSPVLLIGDSHTLIFHDPALVARGAGLPDHLALRLGIPVDLIGVRGSGATTTRIELLRRKDNLQGKQLVIWCFSFREFTESTTGWRKIPVIR